MSEVPLAGGQGIVKSRDSAERTYTKAEGSESLLERMTPKIDAELDSSFLASGSPVASEQLPVFHVSLCQCLIQCSCFSLS